MSRRPMLHNATTKILKFSNLNPELIVVQWERECVFGGERLNNPTKTEIA